MKYRPFVHLFLTNTLCFVCLNLESQSNFSLSNPDCMALLKGEFKEDSFKKPLVLKTDDVLLYLRDNINADSMKQYLLDLVKIPNRNTIFDSENHPEAGIRGARNWVNSKISYWAKETGSILIPCEFSFDYLMCGKLRHTQLMGIIPGTAALRNELIIVEAHLDSRCENECDTTCLAYGAEDNGSGVGLIMELARVFSKINLDRTLVIIWTTGEEQGLGGARAFATYCKSNGLKVKAVFNNDVVGGVECGITSSPPSCPGEGLIDSMRVRIFSSGLNNSMPKMMARLSKIIYEKKLSPLLTDKLKIDLMSGEDRSGRGGDHIPFREQGFNAIRFTSSYEHGDGNPTQANYHDRQHSVRDILGKDVDGDLKIDSYYVHFNYLKNNTLLNALSILNISNTQTLSVIDTITVRSGFMTVRLPSLPPNYRHVLGIRKLTTIHFDTLIITDQNVIEIPVVSSIYYVSVAVEHPDGLIGMFSNEKSIRTLSHLNDIRDNNGIILFQNKPNPFDEVSFIPIFLAEDVDIKTALLSITNEQGILIKKITLDLKRGMNEIIYDHSHHNYQPGVYIYTLWVNGRIMDSKKLQVTN